MVSESLGHLADLLIFELENLENFSILSLLIGPFMLHRFCQQLLQLGLSLPQQGLDLL